MPTPISDMRWSASLSRGSGNARDCWLTDNKWVVSGPHVMVLTPDAPQLDALPTDPNNGGPWVMWKGTKYAHIMVPTTAMPKQPAAMAPSK